MTAPNDPGPPPAPSTGIAAEAMRLFGSLTQHLQSLAALAGLEGREAAALYVRIAIVLGAALGAAAFAYVFLLLFAAFAIEKYLHGEWIWITLGLGIFHLLAAVIAAAYVKRACRTPIFRGTAEEIRKDVASLRGPAVPTPPAT